MPINLTSHITHQLEAYLDSQLPLEERWLVEAHLDHCSTCRAYLLELQRLRRELGPTMWDRLGRPAPPPALRYRVRQSLQLVRATPTFPWRWSVPGRILNTAGTLAIVTLLAVGVLTVIQHYPPDLQTFPALVSLHPGADGGPISATVTAPAGSALALQVTPAPVRTSLGDTLDLAEPTAGSPASPTDPPANSSVGAPSPGQSETAHNVELFPPAGPSLPRGTIAFAFYNAAPGREMYEIHLVNSDGTNHRLFPLDGVSEPALRRTGDGSYHLAYRAWSEPTSPRSLLSSDLSGERPDLIGGFWEDAQPDWSPVENRLIFASQREVDRRWRLYTIWGDGSAELNLRREGRSPTFAPEGQRFAFESCDSSGEDCGLWLGDLANSEYGSQLFLADPLARSPDWSPAGEQIAYMANPAGNWDLYLTTSEGSEPRRLTDDPAIDGLPAWSPDGEWLAFLSDRDGNWGIWLLHLASNQVQQVYDFDGGTFTPPARPPYNERSWEDEQISWSE